jgi:hypothetical protein
METLEFDGVWSGGCRLEVVDGDVGRWRCRHFVKRPPHAPLLHLQLPDVLPQFANMPRLNPDSTREFVMGYVRRSAR